MDRIRALAGAALVGMAAAAGCSGGSGSVPHTPAGPATAQFSISVPQSTSSSAARRPQFQAPGGTESVSIALTSVNGTAQSGTPTVANLSSSTTGCSASSGTLTCEVSVPAVAGTDVFTVTTYSQPDAKGTSLGTGTASVTAVAGQTTVAPVTLSGTIATITLALGTPPIQGVANSIPLVVTARDAGGATILGTYNAPITLTDSDTSGATKLSATTLADSTAASNVSITYNGAAMANAAAIGATEGTLASSAITGVSFQPNTDYAPADGSSMTYGMSISQVYTPTGSTPQPTQTASATMTATYSTGASYNGQSNLLHVHQAYSGASGFYFGFSSQDTQDEYYAWQPTKSGANLFDVGGVESWLDQTGKTQTWSIDYAAPGYQIAQVPFASGNAWNAADQLTESETYPMYDGSGNQTGTYTDKYTENADGSGHETYGETMNDGSSWNDQYVINSDGSETETDVSTTSTSSSTEVWTVGTPEPAPSGTPGQVIKYTDTVTAESPAPQVSPTPNVTYGPDWYPGGAPPSPLRTNKMTDEGSGAIPSVCNIPSSMATSAEHIQQKTTETDPWGYLFAETNDYYYAQGIGLLCEVGDELQSDYDTSTTGQLQDTYDTQIVQAATSTSLQTALRKSRDMASAASFESAGIQSGVATIEQRIRLQHTASSHARSISARKRKR